jgi:universal stress protein A
MVMKSSGINSCPKQVLVLKRILVTTDFSDESRKAFRYAVAFAEQFGASLDVLSIVESVPIMSGMEVVPIAMDSSSWRASARKVLRDWIAKEVPPTVPAKALVREGKAFLEIVAVAQECGSDLIVISTHGYRGLKRVFMGRTVERVVRHAPCPVLVVRQNEHDFLARSKQRKSTKKIGVKAKRRV